MSSQALNRRLNAVKSRIPVAVKPEEDAALQYIFVYLDALAHRKQTGNPTVQAEIEAVGKIMSLIPYQVDTSWIETTLMDVRTCLQSTTTPNHAANCEYGTFLDALGSNG